jgi:hypothetical protein
MPCGFCISVSLLAILSRIQTLGKNRIFFLKVSLALTLLTLLEIEEFALIAAPPPPWPLRQVEII